MKTRRLTMAQGVIQFLMHQHVERDGKRQPFFAGCFGIFGHGNVAGIGIKKARQVKSAAERYLQEEAKKRAELDALKGKPPESGATA